MAPHYQGCIFKSLPEGTVEDFFCFISLGLRTCPLALSEFTSKFPGASMQTWRLGKMQIQNSQLIPKSMQGEDVDLQSSGLLNGSV